MNTYYVITKDTSVVDHLNIIFKEYSNFNFIGSAGLYDVAMNAILKYLPHLVFLDLDCLEQESFKMAQEINCYTNKCALITAMSSSKDQAYESIKMGFLDYLLKPLKELDIRKSIIKCNRSISTQSVSTVCLRSYKDYQYLNTDEILFLKADNNATDFHMNDGKVISAYKTLKTFENLLPDNFLRIHKSYIINSDYVSRINYGKLVCSISRSSLNIPFTKTYFDNVESINQALSKSSLISLN